MSNVTDAGLVLLVLLISLQSVSGGKHSLHYLYTIQSKDSDSDSSYDYTVLTLLNDRQIDFYNSTDQSRTKPDWIPERNWKKGKEKLKDDGWWLNKQLDTLMNKFGHSQSDGHILQWRHGCEGEDHPDGSVTVLNSINEYGYDGEDLMYFNCTSEKWMISDKLNREKKETLEEKWNKEERGKAVFKCEECEEFLKMYLALNNTTDIKQTKLDVHMFTRKLTSDPCKLILTCLATGLYHKDGMMRMRKFTTTLPEHLVTSSGVRPNDDGTYQLRKSVEIREELEKYDCYVTHRTFKEPLTAHCDKKCQRGSNAGEIEGWTEVVVILFFMSLIVILVLILKMIKDAGTLIEGVAVLLFLLLPVFTVLMKILGKDKKCQNGMLGGGTGEETGIVIGSTVLLLLNVGVIITLPTYTWRNSVRRSLVPVAGSSH